MRSVEQQKKEIVTIRNRLLNLRLSDADVQRLSETAGKVGLTVSQLLENFIGDLVDGTYSNGSDERMIAEQWLDRCGFTMFAEKSLLRYSLFNGCLDVLLTVWDERIKLLQELSDMEQYPENATDEEITDLKDELSYQEKTINTLYAEYRQYNPMSRNLEDEMKFVLQWRENYHKLLES